jgi:hypothetical protein
MTEKSQLRYRREQSRRLSRSIDSLRTAFRYALEADDTFMVEDIKGYATDKLSLNGLEINYVYNSAKDEEKEE